jgi:hypothetical protein
LYHCYLLEFTSFYINIVVLGLGVGVGLGLGVGMGMGVGVGEVWVWVWVLGVGVCVNSASTVLSLCHDWVSTQRPVLPAPLGAAINKN